MATDGAGNIFVADTFNNRIEEFSPAPVPEPASLALALALAAAGAAILLGARAWTRRRAGA